MADLRIDLAAEFRGKKAFKEADKAVTSLDKAVGKLGKQVASVFAAQKVYAFGKSVVKAFAEDQASAAVLSNTLKNLGLAFADLDIKKFIDNLSLAAGVADDELRPAMQRLLTTTGSVAKSQDLLKNAIDIAKGSGQSLETVALDLANAYVGNNKGLKKYTLGLSAAELKTASFDKVLAAFNKNFSGANAAFLSTYAGQLEVISVAGKEAKETIGQGLVDAFKLLAGNTGLDNLSKKIGQLATDVADFFRGLAIGFRDLANMPVIKQLLQLSGLMLKVIGKAAGFFIDPFVKAGKESRSKGYGDYAGSTDAFMRDKNAKAAAAAEAAAKKRAKELLAAQNKNTTELKKQAALKKAQGVFDLEQIQLVAALKGKLSEEEKIRVEAQLALLNGNVELAKKLTDQILAAQDSTGNLSRFLSTLPNARNPFEYLDGYLNYLANKAATLVTGKTEGNSSVMPSIPSTNVPSNPSDNMISYNVLTGLNYNPNAGQPVINVTVQGSVIKEQELIAQIQNGTQLASLSGSPSQIGRIAGMFG